VKKLVGIVILGLLLSGNAFGQSMVSLKTYVEKNKNDENYLDYIFYRCSAAYTYAGRSTKDKQIQNEIILVASSIHIYRAKVLMKTMGLTIDSAFKRVDDHITLIHQLYINDGYEYHAKTGDYLAPYIKEDLLVCRELLEPVMKDILKHTK
jgi:hypothetical protein